MRLNHLLVRHARHCFLFQSSRQARQASERGFTITSSLTKQHQSNSYLRSYATNTTCWTNYKLKTCVKACLAEGGENGSHPTGCKTNVDYVFSDVSSMKLQRRAVITWPDKAPQNVLIVKKAGSKVAAVALEKIANWLHSQGMSVFVERAVHKQEFPHFNEFAAEAEPMDFCITLGGDGTVLHLASLFDIDEPLPPVVCFAMGTLGFLTPFNVLDFRTVLSCVLHANRHEVYCTLRARKRCTVLDEGGQVLRVHNVLNECLIDRGVSASMVTVNVLIDGYHVTTVQADGLIIATPSGSTAYSMSANGPMVAPSVPCTLLTPIAPHSLSFRPLVVPESSEVEVHLPMKQRSHGRASFDGRHTMRLTKGSTIKCSTSLCPLPLINLMALDADWYEGIVQKLKWNLSIRDVAQREHPHDVSILPDVEAM